MKLLSNSILAVLVLALATNSHPAEGVPRFSRFMPDGMLGAPTCDSRPDWSAANFLKEDCYNSVLDVFLQDYRPHPKAKFNFYSSIIPPPPGSNRVQTPRRYTTILVMLYRFGFAELPGIVRRGHALTELATFEEIYKAARRLEENCIVGQGQTSWLAWEPVGATKSLGLFFWATDSRINRDNRFRGAIVAGARVNVSKIALDRDISSG